MKAAIIFESDRANFTEDLTAAGLRALLGATNVAWWPAKEHLAGPQPASDLAPEAALWIGPPDRSAAEGDLLSAISQGAFDLLVIGSPNAEGHAAVALEAIERAPESVRCVLLDGDDRPDFAKLEGLLPDGPWFVRECPSAIDDARVKPLPFAVNTVTTPRPLAWGRRDIDVLWAGTNHYGRPKFVEALGALARSRGRVTVLGDRALAFSDWNALLTRSKVCVCLTGAGRATYRYFECAAAGCVPAVEPHGLEMPDDYPGVEVMSFRDPAQMTAILERMLARDEALQHMAHEAFEQVWTFHTPAARAAYLVQNCFLE